MGTCPNCGSYVSPGTNVCSCGTTFTNDSQEVKKESQTTEYERLREEKRKVRNAYFKKAKKLMDDGNYTEAIKIIDMLLETSKTGFYIMAKAEACYYAGMYEEALQLFRESLRHYSGIETYPIFEWIGDTLIEMNRFDEARDAYEEAIDIINKDYERHINFINEERWSHPSDSFLKYLKDEKNAMLSGVQERIKYSERLKSEAALNFDENEELLKQIGKENLITIAGTFFHDNPKFERGMKLKLEKEWDNEFDCDAIAVYSNGVKVGYAANSSRTCCHLTSKASDIEIPDIAYAEYLMHFADMFHIARIKRPY